MDQFDRHFAKTRNLIVLAVIAKLAVFGGLIWLAVYAIDKFAG